MIEAHSPVDWGNVPAWLGSILSTVSVLLVIFVILRDRRVNKRKQADELTCAVSFGTRTRKVNQREYTHYQVVLHNSSSSPFTQVRLVAEPISSNFVQLVPGNQTVIAKQKGLALKEDETDPAGVDILGNVLRVSDDMDTAIFIENLDRTNDNQRPAWLAPTETMTLSMSLLLPIDYYVPCLYFTDGNNRRWVRDLKTWKLRKNRKKLVST